MKVPFLFYYYDEKGFLRDLGNIGYLRYKHNLQFIFLYNSLFLPLAKHLAKHYLANNTQHTVASNICFESWCKLWAVCAYWLNQARMHCVGRLRMYNRSLSSSRVTGRSSEVYKFGLSSNLEIFIDQCIVIVYSFVWVDEFCCKFIAQRLLASLEKTTGYLFACRYIRR